MKNILSAFLITSICLSVYGQTTDKLVRPKLVVGIVVDQMRWDYLYRYYDRYDANGGFKRLLGQGFACENTSIPYTPTITACGHASIFTGSVPAIHGIAGNDWWDYDLNNYMYATDDANTTTIGSKSAEGKMSPRNLLSSTIGDELMLATNFRSKVIGIALKDRSAILPAGHSANSAYWYDHSTGDWISSSYYVNELPAWLKAFNEKKLTDQYYAQDWNSMYPTDTYVQSVPGNRGFPKKLQQYAGKNYQVIVATPFGNNLTIEMAKATIAGEQLGADDITDLLTVSFSTPDYIGHAYGPNSIEEEDCFLTLDKELGKFLDFLDTQMGKGNYLLFLTADHGAANVPALLQEHKIPAGNFDSETMEANLSKYLDDKFRTKNLLKGILNYQVYLDRNELASKKLNKDSVYNNITAFVSKDPAVQTVVAFEKLNNTTLNKRLKEAFSNGYYPARSGDMQIILQPQWIDGFLKGGTTHGVWNPYDSHIPLLWYGWHIKAGKTYKEFFITDIAPTVAALLNVQAPSGSVGSIIEDLVK